MPAGEFELIDRYFRRPLPARDDVLVGIGDDGALLRVGAGQRLVTAVATLSTAAWDASSGDPSRLGHDAMAMALNRLAAAGAKPAWATLALTLPEAEEHWLATFSDALFAVAAPWSVALVGGDTTRGPFTVTVVGHGLLDDDSAQAQSRVGDDLYMSGALGAGLAGTRSTRRSTPRSASATIRVELGQWIRRHGGVAVDLSEGVGAALTALLARGALGVAIELSRLPLVPGLRRHLDDEDGWSELLSHRGDMELCFTLAPQIHGDMTARAAHLRIPVTRLASVDDSGVVALLTADGRSLRLPAGRRGVLPS